MTQERRTTDRSRTLLGGWVAFNNRSATLDCVVRNISETGALLLIEEPFRAPSRMELSVRQTGEVHTARVVWRGERGIGVAFTSKESGDLIPLPAARRAMSLGALKAAATQSGEARAEPA